MKFNGLRTDAPKYSPTVKEHVIEVTHDMRPYAYLADDAEPGMRFNNDDHIVWLLESNIPESQLNGNTHQWVLAALMEAARSDYWYTHEKVWE